MSHASSKNPWWEKPLSECKRDLEADDNGLSTPEADSRLARFGPNRFRDRREQALPVQFLMRFKNPLVIILLVASAVSALTGEVADFLIITCIVVLSVTLDFVQEYRAGRAAERLRESVSVRVSVLRDGAAKEVPVVEVVPGDVALLSAGDLVPADGRVLEARDFFVKQALLTGEPYPVEKRPGDLAVDAGDLQDATNAVFMGTSVISGSARMLVFATGADTAIGEIADSLARRPPSRWAPIVSACSSCA
jgi:Mg2+-importing ATPase